MKYKIRLYALPDSGRKTHLPLNYRGILRKTGTNDNYSFKLNGNNLLFLELGETRDTTLSFLVGERPDHMIKDNEFEVIELGKVICLGRFLD